jgi:hypothetical protein
VQRGDVLALKWTLAVPTIAASALLFELDARADSCTSPDLIETMPPLGAMNVPTNAILFARYASIAQYLSEPVQLEHVGVATSTVPATFDDTSGMLQIVPPNGLVAGAAYVVHWPALRGLDTATLGSTFDLNFTAGSTADALPPTFAGIASMSWDVSRNSDSCTNSVEQRYVYSLSLTTAADDSGRDSLTLLVFQTSGPTLEGGAPAQVLVQRIPAAGRSAQVTTTVGSGVGHICFTAIVRDLTLKTSPSGPPVCVDTVAPPFFYGCGMVAGHGARGALGIAFGAAAIGLARRARRRSRERSAPPGQGRGGR